MKTKTITRIVLTVLLIGTLTLMFNIQKAEASEPPWLEWTRTYGGYEGEGGWNDDSAKSVVQTADGGYAIAGSTGSFGLGELDFWLIKTDSAGNQQWNKTYGGEGWEGGWSMIQTSDGGYAIAGYTKPSNILST